MLSDSRETALAKSLGRRIIVDEIGMFGAHFPVARGFVPRTRPFVLVAVSSSATYLGGFVALLLRLTIYSFNMLVSCIYVALKKWLPTQGGCISFFGDVFFWSICDA